MPKDIIAGTANIPALKGEKGDKGDKGDNYVMTESDFNRIESDITEITNSRVNQNADERITEIGNTAVQQIAEINVLADTKKTELENINNTLTPRVSKLETDIIEVEEIAKGRNKAHVFDTKSDMETWISQHSSELSVGDNLYIKAVDVPDYWWDGVQAQQLETQKVDLTDYYNKEQTDTKLTDYVKNTDYATSSKGGVIQVGAYSVYIGTDGKLRCNGRTMQEYETISNVDFISKGTLENVLNERIGTIETALDLLIEKSEV